MTPKPFRSIAFIPDQNADVSLAAKEAIWLGENLAARLFLIYSDVTDVATKQNLEQLTSDANLPIKWIFEDGDLLEAALRISSENEVDLVVTAAQPREGLMSYYSASIGRRLLKKADCSVMLLSPNRILNFQCRRIVVDGIEHPKTAHTIKLAHYFAKSLNAEMMILATQASEGSPDLGQSEGLAWEARLEENIKDGHLKLLKHPLNGKRGYSLSNFSLETDADFLILNSPDTKLGYKDRVFTQELEYILTEVPTNLLIVHSTQAR